jgi:hypothetical protein
MLDDTTVFFPLQRLHEIVIELHSIPYTVQSFCCGDECECDILCHSDVFVCPKRIRMVARYSQVQVKEKLIYLILSSDY